MPEKSNHLLPVITKVMSDRDWDDYRSFFSPEATLTTIWQDSPDADPRIFSNTISQFIAQTPQGPDSQPIFEERPLEIEVDQRGNLATVWAKYTAKFGTEENLYTWEGTDLFVLMKFNGRWYITSLAYVSE